MDLGAFSLSPSVKDLSMSQDFYAWLSWLKATCNQLPDKFVWKAWYGSIFSCMDFSR